MANKRLIRAIHRRMITQKSIKTSLFMAIAGYLTAVGTLCAAAQNGAAPPSSWAQSSMPIVYYVNADDAAAWPEGVGAIVRSFMTWERAPGAYVRFQYAGTTDKKIAYDDGHNIVTWIKNGWPYGSDTIGFAVLWLSGDGQKILGVDILLNGEDFVWAADGDAEAVDVQDVATHEVGHALGLSHSVTSPDLVMFPIILPGETKKRFISPEEQLIISLLYPSGTTRVLTYAFSEGIRGLFAEKAVTDYPSTADPGRILLLTRVDGDGNGLDEIGTIQEKDGQLGFYLFPAVTSDFPTSEPVAYDEWSIPVGDILDLTALDIDGDGREEIGVLRAENDGTYALYIYDAPLPSAFTEEDAPILALRQTFRADAGDNLIAAMGLDYDEDGIDEVAVVRVTTTGEYFFDVHYIRGRDDEFADAAFSIPLGSNFTFIDLDVSDIDGDETQELVALLKDSRGWYVSAFQLPDSSAPLEEPQMTFLTSVRITLPAGRRPMRISSLRIANAGTLRRPAICILTGESL